MVHCPVEMNLMPKTSIQRQEFSQKKPYLIAAFFSLALVVFAIGMFYDRMLALRRAKWDEILGKPTPLRSKERQIKPGELPMAHTQREGDQVSQLNAQRFFWVEVVQARRRDVVGASGKTHGPEQPDTCV